MTGRQWAAFTKQPPAPVLQRKTRLKSIHMIPESNTSSWHAMSQVLGEGELLMVVVFKVPKQFIPVV